MRTRSGLDQPNCELVSHIVGEDDASNVLLADQRLAQEMERCRQRASILVEVSGSRRGGGHDNHSQGMLRVSDLL